MSITTGVGLASGIDTASLIDQLIQIESRPKTLVQNQITVLSAQQAAFMDINARILSINNSVTSLLSSNTYNSFTATSSDTSVLTATAGNDASPGSFSISVAQLVSSQKMLSDSFTDTTSAIGAGTLTFESAAGRLDRVALVSELNGFTGIERGSIRITDRSGAQADIDLSKVVTVDDILDAINSSTAVNVTASVTGDSLTITDNTGQTTSDLIIQDVGMASTATSLGIAGNSSSTTTITGQNISYINTDTSLYQINDDLGVRMATLQSPPSTDFSITGHDGVTFEVALRWEETVDDETVVRQAATIGDIIDRVNDAASTAGSTVTAAIGDDGVSIKLVDTTPFGATNFTIGAVNGSLAAGDLGFIRNDIDHDGIIEGDRVLAGIGSTLLKNINGGSGIDLVSSYYPSELTADTLLSDLFDGAGLTYEPSGFDFKIRASDRKFVEMRIEMTGLTTVQDFIDEVDTITGGRIQITIEERSLRLTDTTSGPEDLRVTDLGASRVVRSLFGSNIDGPIKTVLGVDTIPARQVIPDTFGAGQFSITNRNGVETEIALDTARSLADVLSAINNAGAGVTATLNDAGNGIKITDITGGTSDIIIADTTGTIAAKLGLTGTYSSDTADSGDLDIRYISESTRLDDMNSGRGVAAGKFKITNSEGVYAIIDLTQDETTLSRVIQEINALHPTVTAAINDTGDGIILTDSASGAVRMKVEEYGSSTAADLGILGEDDGTVANGYINGSFEKTIEIDAEDTLSDVVSKINDADVHATASLFNTGSSYKMILSASETGSQGAFLFDDGGLDFGMRTITEAADAAAFIENELVTSSSNTLSDTIAGVTIDLVSTSDTPVDVNIAADFSTVTAAAESFISGFNDLMDRIESLDSYDTENEERSLLLGDSTLAGIKSGLYSYITRNYSDVEGRYTYLHQIGITIGDDTKLELDSDKLLSALETDPDAVAQLLSLKGTTASEPEQILDENGDPIAGATLPAGESTVTSQGVAAMFESFIESLTNSTNGRLTLTNQRFTDQIDAANDRIEYLDTILAHKRSRLEQQFLAMELAIASLQSQSSAISQLASLASQSTV